MEDFVKCDGRKEKEKERNGKKKVS